MKVAVITQAARVYPWIDAMDVYLPIGSLVVVEPSSRVKFSADDGYDPCGETYRFKQQWEIHKSDLEILGDL